MQSFESDRSAYCAVLLPCRAPDCFHETMVQKLSVAYENLMSGGEAVRTLRLPRADAPERHWMPL